MGFGICIPSCLIPFRSPFPVTAFLIYISIAHYVFLYGKSFGEIGLLLRPYNAFFTWFKFWLKITSLPQKCWSDKKWLFRCMFDHRSHLCKCIRSRPFCPRKCHHSDRVSLKMFILRFYLFQPLLFQSLRWITFLNPYLCFFSRDPFHYLQLGLCFLSIFNRNIIAFSNYLYFRCILEINVNKAFRTHWLLTGRLRSWLRRIHRSNRTCSQVHLRSRCIHRHSGKVFVNMGHWSRTWWMTFGTFSRVVKYIIFKIFPIL